MNAKTFVTVAVAALLVAGTFAIAQAPTPPKPDPRVDKLSAEQKKYLTSWEEGT